MCRKRILKIVFIFLCLFSSNVLLAETEYLSADEASADAMNTISTLTPAPPAPPAPTPPPASPAPAAKPTPAAPVSPPAPPAKPVTQEYNASGELPVCNENCSVKNPPKCCSKK